MEKRHKRGDTVWLRGKVRYRLKCGYTIKIVGYNTNLFFTPQGLHAAIKSKNRGW